VHQAAVGVTAAILVCPVDRTLLEKTGDDWTCGRCGRAYQEHSNVVQFLDTEDAFYEGAYLNRIHFLPKDEKLHHVWPVWLINNGYVWRVRSNVPEGSSVLELGCAGGIAYFAKRYRMIGLDVSMSSLKQAGEIYDKCIQADAAAMIPLADSSVDAVASSFFWEHIPPVSKRAILAELRRVLKPKGRLIFLYDVETMNPLISAMRKSSSSRYREEFIDRDGHLGYETPRANLETFERSGFNVIEQLGLERTPLQSTTVYSKMRKWPQPFAAAGSLLHNIDKSRAALFPYIGVLRALDETVGKILPDRWSRMALTVCEKKD
jgi:ubiquinone/menaquinone biosynthesis C-methylase UbiE